MLARISDLVGAAFFFAILNLLLGFARAGGKRPQIQLGAENNIEKSRCLAQLRKKICAEVGAWCWFFRLPRRLELGRGLRRADVHCDFRHVGGDVQRSSTSKAPITIDTQSTEKSI
jgi:hypothetical protein